MKIMGLVLKLRPGCYDEYKKRHDNLWPEMAEAMRANGIYSAIFRFEEYLFVYQTAPSEEAWQRMGSDPVTPRWNKHMTEVLETNEKGEVIVFDLPLAFEFGVFARSKIKGAE